MLMLNAPNFTINTSEGQRGRSGRQVLIVAVVKQAGVSVIMLSVVECSFSDRSMMVSKS